MGNNERHLLCLLKRLLRHDEELQVLVDRQTRVIKRVCRDYCALRAQLDKERADSGVVQAASDAMIGAALSEPGGSPTMTVS